MGEQDVKNISEPVRIYRLLTGPADAGKLIGDKRPKSRKSLYIAFSAVGLIILVVGIYVIWNNYLSVQIEPASIEKMEYSLPGKPSIAVLPFVNMSDNPKQDYLCDGLAEDIITVLSKVRNMFVIARNTTFTYKGKAVKIRQVAEELGVRYVLEGSVQKSQDRLRINAQLIDAVKGHHLWAERYDRKLQDLFNLQDEITKKILTSLQVEIAEGEEARLWGKGTNNLEAYLKILQARQLLQNNEEDNIRGQQLIKEAIDLDPQYAMAYLALGAAYVLEHMMGWGKFPQQSLARAQKMAQKAIKIDDTLAEVYALMGRIFLAKGQHENAVSEGEKAYALDPNSTHVLAALAYSLQFSGRPKEAIEYYKKAIRLDSIPPSWYMYGLGRAYRDAGQYQEAIEAFKKLLSRSPKSLWAHICLTATYSLAGREEEARAIAAEALNIDPNLYAEYFIKPLPYNDRTYKKGLIDALRKAGLPEHPPFPLPDKPSIAVLAFDNLSGDPEQEYFSDGMTDELISDLAKIENILVISRNFSFSYKGRKMKIAQIAQELNVRYVLEGSVQKSGNKVRIRAQLIDGKSDYHIWSESYDGVIDDIFELQDKITEKIVSALAVKLSPGEENRRTEKQTGNTSAYNAYLKGMAHLRLYTPDAVVKAIEFFKKAVTLDSNYGNAYTALAEAYRQVGLGSRKLQRQLGVHYEDCVIYQRYYLNLAMNNPVPKTFAALARLETTLRDWDKVISYAEKAVALAPNDAGVLYDAGRAMSWADRPQEALKYLKKSNILDPLNRAGVFRVCPYFSLKQYKEQVAAFEEVAPNVRNDVGILPYAAASYAYLGRKKEAKAVIKQWNAMVRRLTADEIYGYYPQKNPEVFDRLMEGITKAGREGGTKIYIAVDQNSKLTGKKIKKLMFGKTEIVSGSFGDEFLHRKEGGVATFQIGDSVKKGLSWIEKDKLCNRFDKMFGGYNDCFYIYENPKGDAKYKNDYLKVTDYGIVPFTLKQ